MLFPGFADDHVNVFDRLLSVSRHIMAAQIGDQIPKWRGRDMLGSHFGDYLLDEAEVFLGLR